MAKICWQIVTAILAKENFNKSNKNNKHSRVEERKMRKREKTLDKPRNLAKVTKDYLVNKNRK